MNSGDAIGPYVIHSALGSGGMGKVYRARDSRLGREVALKQLSDPSLTTDAARRRILQEARAAAGLSHPNIAAIFDVLDTAEGPAIVMEYVPGESLAKHIARGRWAAPRAVEIATQIAEGLAEAHARGIVHRDLKPANVQITPAGRAKILDFGIARLGAIAAVDPSATTASATTETARIAGTPGYMAPEQLAGGPTDARTDIYALGVLLYETLAGRKPYPATDLLGSALAIMQGGAPPVAELVPGTPPIVSAIVERAMAKDPADRFQTAGELVRELERANVFLARGEQPDAGGAALEGSRRIRAAAPRLMLAGIALIILAGLGWQWVRTSNAPEPLPQGAVFALLPFEASSPGDADDVLAAGLTEAIASRLASLQTIRLLPLDQSREAATDSPGDAPAIARALGARFVVAGNLQTSGQKVDVAMWLVGPDGRRREAGRHTTEIAKAFDLHPRIAQDVIKAIAAENAIELPAEPASASPLSQEASAEYLQARYFLDHASNPNNVDQAIGLFQSAIAKDSRFALAHAGLGEAFWAKYRRTRDRDWTTRAQNAIIDALAIDPDRPEVRLSLAVMYRGSGKLEQAETELHRVIALQPHNDDAHRLLAGVYNDRGQWDDAAASAELAMTLRPTYWRNHGELGLAHWGAGRSEAAIKAFKRVTELRPDVSTGFHNLGTVQQSAGLLDEALIAYAKANSIRKGAATYANIGTIKFWRGDYRGAAAAYQSAIDLEPNRPVSHANLGDALLKLGQRERARDSYKRAVAVVRKLLDVNRTDASNLSLLAMYLAKLEDRAGADAAVRQALALNPENRHVMYAAAMVDALAQRQAEACGKLQKAVTLGQSAVIIRHADEFRVLKGCDAYDQVVRANSSTH